jgi:hypothetical protein
VHSVGVSGSVATIDLSTQFVSGGGSLSMQERVAQVVFTLTGIPGVDRVAFKIDGAPVTTIGGEGVIVSPPVGRASFAAFEPQVLVATPAPGDVVTSPVVVTGEINSFEGVGTFELRGPDGRLLAEGFGMGAMGEWLPFAVALDSSLGSDASGWLFARPSQGREGLAPPDAVIPVRFRG